MSTSPIYYFRDTKAGADANAVAGSDANSGLTDALAKRTYGEFMSLLNSAPAGTRFKFARSCGFTDLASVRITNPLSSSEITSLTRSGSVATAITNKIHNLEVGDVFIVRNVAEAEYNGNITVTGVPTTTSFTYTVTGTPATPASIAPRSRAIRYEGGMIHIEDYVTTQFTPVNDTRAFITYIATGYMHNLDTNAVVEGLFFKDLSYKFGGVSGVGTPNWMICYSGENDAFYFDNLIIDGFRLFVYYSGKGNAPSVQYDSRMTNCQVINNWNQGLLGSPKNGLFENNIFHNNGHNNGNGVPTLHNIYFNSCDMTTIRNNDLYQSAMNAGKANGTSLIIHGVVNGLIIEDNVIREDNGAANNAAWSIGVDVGYSTPESFSNCIIRRNICINGGNTGIHGTSNIDCLYENNVIINQQAGVNFRGFIFDANNVGAGDGVNTRVTIRNNSMYGHFLQGIRVRTGTGMKVHNNVLHHNGPNAAYMLDKGSLSITNNTNFDGIDNNTMYATGGGAALWEFSTGSLASWLVASIFDNNSQVANPLYTNTTPNSENLKQLPGSSLINYGNLFESALEDFDQLTRDATPDAGAYELGGGGTPPTTGNLTGTLLAGAAESAVVAGGLTSIIALTDDTWLAAGAPFDAQRQAIINGVNSSQSELMGWNNEVRNNESVASVVRTSNTIVTITWSASPNYSITANETVTHVIPPSALTISTTNVFVLPTTLTITDNPPVVASAAIAGTIVPAVAESSIVAGGLTTTITLTNAAWAAAGTAFDAQRQSIINGCISAGNETNGWNNEVRNKEVVTSVVRTNATTVTITWTTAANYLITGDEIITVTVPGGATV